MTLKKEAEKPSCLSTGILRVFRKNEAENAKLKEKIKEIEREERQNKIATIDDIHALRQTLLSIAKVKDKISVSGMRRRFLADHGYIMQQEQMNTEEFLGSLDKIIYTPMGTAIPLLFKQKPREDEDADIDKETLQSQKNSVQYEEIITEQMEELKPYQFRKIVPPLKGRKIGEVYEEMKEEGKKMLKIQEMEDFRRRSRHFESIMSKKINRNKQINDLEIEIFEHEDYVTEDLNVPTRSNSRDGINIEISPKRDDVTMQEKVSNVIKVHTRKDSPVQRKIGARERRATPIIGNVRPLSCPPVAVQNCRLRTRKNAILESCSGRSERGKTLPTAWGDNKNANEVTITERRLEVKSRQRPKSCSEVFSREFSPPMQRKISSSNNVDQQRPVRKISYGNGYEVEKEIVYDARPRDAMTTGYATLQRTVGKKCVSVYIPKFKNKVTYNERMRNGKATYTFDIEQQRIQRLRHKIEHEGS